MQPNRINLELAALFPYLEEVTLPNLLRDETRTSQLEFLKRVKRLKVLHLSQPTYTLPTRSKDHVNDEFLAELSAIPSLKGLKTLNLGCCSRVTAEGLKVIKCLSALETLTACICSAVDCKADEPAFWAKCAVKQHDIFCFANRFEEI